LSVLTFPGSERQVREQRERDQVLRLLAEEEEAIRIQRQKQEEENER
jgi:hypothetical protein